MTPNGAASVIVQGGTVFRSPGMDIDEYAPNYALQHQSPGAKTQG
ncbi:MAG: hypothetical protein PUC06_02460 [Oscillospiraceae bacterium]|nr:hypothetical protein [Oscillospiraceae bacterium]